MFRYIKFLIFILIPVIVFFSYDSVDSFPELPGVRVALPNVPPLSFLEGDTPKGFVVDILNHISIEEQLNLIYTPLDWPDAYRAVLKGDVDIIPCIAYSEERNKELVFSKEPIATGWSAVYTSDKSDKYSNILELDGKIIGISKDDISSINFKKLCDSFKVNPVFIEYINYEEMLKGLLKNNTDAVVLNSMVGYMYKKKYGVVETPILFSPIDSLFAVKRDSGNEYLLDIIDNWVGIHKYRKDSIFYAFRDKWFGYRIGSDTIIPDWLTVTVIVLFVCTFLFIGVTLFLRNRVHTKTKALREAIYEITTNEERLKSLVTVHELNGSVDSDFLVDYALEEAVKITDSEGGYLHFVEDVGEELNLSLFAWSAHVKEICEADKTPHYPIGSAGIWADSIRLKKPIIHNDYPNNEDKKGLPEGHFPIYRHMSVPIIIGDKIVAVIGVANKKEPYTEFDARQLSLHIKSMWDVLEKKKYEETVNTNTQLINDLLDNLQVGVFMVDVPKGTPILVNKFAMNILGKGIVPNTVKETLAEVYQIYKQNTGELYPLDQQPLTRGMNGETCSVNDMVVSRSDGKEILLEVFGSPVRDSHGNIIASLTSFFDITERASLQAQIQQTQKMEAIGTLAGGIAHDFNNILASLMGYTELSLMYVDDAELVSKNLSNILKACERAKDLTQQILTFSRKDDGRMSNVSLNSIIRESLGLLRASIPRNIELKTNIDIENFVVLADPTKIQQVIMNLCTNASHAIGESAGVIEVIVKRTIIDEVESKNYYRELSSGNYIRISVSDTGNGIPKNIMNRIFDPFFTTKARGEGTGLGLSVVHGIIKSHKGDIKVYSEVGKGTTFNIYLPLVELDNEEALENFYEEPLIGNGETIVFIDDEEFILDVGSQMLKRLGYKVFSFGNPNSALKFVVNRCVGKKCDIDLFITDYAMPEMNGVEWASNVLSHIPDAAIILCTGFSEERVKARAWQSGIREVISKPFIMYELSRIIKKVLVENDRIKNGCDS